MKNNRLSRLIVVIVSFLIVIFLSVYFIGANRGKVLNNFYLSTPISKADSFLSMPFKYLSNLRSDIRNFYNTYEQNKVLRDEINSISDSLVSLSNLEKENESLRESLEIKEKYNPTHLISTNIITRSTVSWLDELILNKGSKQNVTESMLAISSGNLVGKIVDVSKGSSTVQLLTNSNITHQIPVKIESSSGTVYGIISSFDSENEVVVVEQLNNDSEISENDAVSTSGLDGDSVAEIPVGTVKQVSDDKKQVFVTLNADFNDIDSVTLVGNS